jgi:hypothetical protein
VGHHDFILVPSITELSAITNDASGVLPLGLEPIQHHAGAALPTEFDLKGNETGRIAANWPQQRAAYASTISQYDRPFPSDLGFDIHSSPPMVSPQPPQTPATPETPSSDINGPFICHAPVCRRNGQPFKTKGDLSRHMQLHRPPTLTCPKPFCPRSRKGFHRKDKLMSHLEKGHGESKDAARMLAWEIEFVRGGG